jgi:hypothetical protein
MDDAEADYIIQAVHFIARHGDKFLRLYNFDLCSGTWSHKQSTTVLPDFSLDAALEIETQEPSTLSLPLREQLYNHYMTEAGRWAAQLQQRSPGVPELLNGELGELQFFAMPGNTPVPH